MEPIVVTTDIDRSPADVYAYASDPRRFPEWQNDVDSVEMVSGEAGAKGSRFKTWRHFGPAKQAITQEVTEADPTNGWTAVVVDGPIRANATLKIQPLDGGRGSRVTFEFTYQAGTLSRLMMPMLVRQTKAVAPRSFARLKRILET